jgi:nucleoside-diphosphate-sugar epimerase
MAKKNFLVTGSSGLIGSDLIKFNLERRTYRVFGYKGKRVRDNIHSYDVARFMDASLTRPAWVKFTILAAAALIRFPYLKRLRAFQRFQVGK